MGRLRLGDRNDQNLAGQGMAEGDLLPALLDDDGPARKALQAEDFFPFGEAEADKLRLVHPEGKADDAEPFADERVAERHGPCG